MIVTFSKRRHVPGNERTVLQHHTQQLHSKHVQLQTRHHNRRWGQHTKTVKEMCVHVGHPAVNHTIRNAEDVPSAMWTLAESLYVSGFGPNCGMPSDVSVFPLKIAGNFASIDAAHAILLPMQFCRRISHSTSRPRAHSSCC